MTTTTAKTIWIGCFLLVAAGTASAQTPSVSAGYQLLHLPDNWINAGFNLDVAAPVTEQLSIIGEFGLAHQGESGSDPVRSTTYHFGAGPRWSWSAPSVTPFVQVLAGAEVAAADIPTVGGVTREETESAFMLQAGGGVYVPVGPRWGVVGQADYRPVFFEGDTDNQFRVVVSVRFALR
jgi:hypothetical protein